MKSLLMIFSMIILRCCWGPSDYQLMLANQNDDTILKALNGTYQIKTLNHVDVSPYNLSITFDDSTKKVSGFSGCNRFFGSYTLNNDALKFGALGTTKMLCADKANKIDSEFLKAIEKANVVMFSKDGFSLFNKKKLLLTASKEVENQSVSFEYSTTTRGASKFIKINKKSISIANQLKGKLKTKICSDSDWDKLLKSVESIDIKNIDNLKAPTQKRLFDGAAIAYLKIIYNGKTYESQSFDHGNPPKEIATLVKEILSISENIE